MTRVETKRASLELMILRIGSSLSSRRICYSRKKVSLFLFYFLETTNQRVHGGGKASRKVKAVGTKKSAVRPVESNAGNLGGT